MIQVILCNYKFVGIFAKIPKQKIYKTKSTDPLTITNLFIIILI